MASAKIEKHDFNNDRSSLSILRLQAVINKTGLSRSAIYVRVEEGTFPRPRKIGERSVGWLSEDIEEWIVSLEEA